MISNIMSIIGIIYMLKIIINPFRFSFYIKDINLSQYSSEEQLLLVGKFEMLILDHEAYTFYQSINAWLIMSVLIFDLRFVGELALIMELISRALMDLIFFVLMFFIVS